MEEMREGQSTLQGPIDSFANDFRQLILKILYV